MSGDRGLTNTNSAKNALKKAMAEAIDDFLRENQEEIIRRAKEKVRTALGPEVLGETPE
jgi:hypothetical protein